VAFAEGDDQGIEDAAAAALERSEVLESIALFDSGGEQLAVVGADDAVAYATATPTGSDADGIGQIAASTTTADRYAEEVAAFTGLDAQVVRDGTTLATTLTDPTGDNPLDTTVDAGDDEFRGRYAGVRDAVGAPVEVGVFQPADEISSSIADDRRLVAAILLGFLLLAVASSILVVRSLGRQIDRFLQAARTVGRGDFEARVPAEGGDEFAALGREFNLMSERLSDNVDELERRREEREETIRRIGEAFATGLERTGIAQLAARTAAGACSAAAGRVLPGDDGAIEPVSVGSDDSSLEAALTAAERRARVAPEETAVVARDGVHALAAALRGGPQADGRREMLGYLAIVRPGRAFEGPERDLFDYLAAQASVSLDNAGLHETVQTQAITDSLTGLNNRRHFEAALEAELGRTRRFGGDVGLVMLDLDGLKPVNDRYGHQEGDRVLVEVARLLRGLTRDVDQVARYGGDEIAIILPQTDLAGSELLAERVRSGIEGLSVRPAGADAPLGLTASFGVAALPETASDRDALLGAADAALLRAKREGGNRIARAEPAPVPR
jgi:diguanylate cyclase (GGDEF)-like protein